MRNGIKKPGTGNQEIRDRYVVYGLLIGFIVWILIMPLMRTGSPGPRTTAGGVTSLGGCHAGRIVFLFSRSHTDNTFPSPLVREQRNPKLQVVSSGGYGFVRKLIYLGRDPAVLQGSLLPGSVWGFVAGLTLSAFSWKDRRGGNSTCAGTGTYMKNVRYGFSFPVFHCG